VGRRAAVHVRPERRPGDRPLRRAATALLLPLLLTACGGASDGPTAAAPTAPASGVQAQLDTATASFTRARSELAAGTAAVSKAAAVLDGADAACATGRHDRARPARRPVRDAVRDADRALRALPGQLVAYRAAADAVASAAGAERLEDDQQHALKAVADRGRAEADADERFRTAAASAWPLYHRLDRAQATWLEHQTAGWYRTTSEAAGAYTVAVSPGRPALDDARSALAAADADRAAAELAGRSALAYADSVLR